VSRNGTLDSNILGLIDTIAWIIATFLPLPIRSDFSKEDPSSQLDVEYALARDVDLLDEIRYHKARWWRNLNRIMSLVGLLIIGGMVGSPHIWWEQRLMHHRRSLWLSPHHVLDDLTPGQVPSKSLLHSVRPLLLSSPGSNEITNLRRLRFTVLCVLQLTVFTLLVSCRFRLAVCDASKPCRKVESTFALRMYFQRCSACGLL